ncbi:MAG: serine/threonine-protein kinase [Pirellulaceae bacterium]
MPVVTGERASSNVADSSLSDKLEPLDELIEEYLDRLRGEEVPAIDELCLMHPSLAEEIRRIFPMLSFLETAAATDTNGEISRPESTSRSAATAWCDLVPNQTFGRYQLRQRIGEGAMGTVFLAYDTELHRKVALKVPQLHSKSSAERFRTEARSMAMVEHPNLCPIYDVGQIDGQSFMSMAFVKGSSLDELLAESGPLPEREAADLVRQLTQAVAEIHKAGIEHRDIKPSNIMIDAQGKPFLMDFGLARLPRDLDEQLTREGDIVGSPAYLAPEQIESELGEAGTVSDVYSLGVVLFEVLAGRRPFIGSPLRVMRRVVTEDPPQLSSIRPGISRQLDAICSKALQRNPAKRFGSAAELATALEDFLESPPPAAIRSVSKPLLFGIGFTAVRHDVRLCCSHSTGWRGDHRACSR